MTATGRILSSRNEKFRVILPWLVLGLAIGGQLLLLAARQTASLVSGDEGTYLAMAESLARDRDLEFGAEDRRRIESYPKGGRQAVILQKTDSGITYSKPAVYPLVGAIPFAVGGQAGLVALNAVALGAVLLLGVAYLRRSEQDQRLASWAVVTFVGTSVLLSYVAWTMSDSLQASFVALGLILCLGAERQRYELERRRLDRLLESRFAPLAGAVLLGLAAGMRYPNALIGLLPLAILVLRRRIGRAVITGLGFGVALLFAVGANLLMEGAPVPHKALRATFNPAVGYPAGEGAQEVLEHFETAQATEQMGLVPQLEPRVSAYASAYFLIGRHTGLLIYFPLAVFLGLAATRRPDTVGVVLLFGAASLVFFHLVWMPRNYFGGATFVGNRYFLTTYALLLVAPLRAPSRRALALAWTVAAVVFASSLVSATGNPALEEPSQSHAYAGIFRLFPYETTAPALDGRRDRYWSDELVRFVDPHARVEEHGFRLNSASPPAELVVTSGRADRMLRFLVQSDHPEGTFVVRDWLRRHRVALEPDGRGGSRGFVEVRTSAPLRRHPYWWDTNTSLEAWSIRVSLDTPDEEESEAEVRYFGPYRFARKFYSGEVIEIELPQRGNTGRRGLVPLRLRNSGWRYWASGDPVPIHLSYRLWPLPRSKHAEPFVGPTTEFAQRVDPGAEVDVEMTLRWPRREGRYEMSVDLVVGGHEWFEDWTGTPLAKARVRVVDTLEKPPGENSEVADDGGG
ncbi:MAG: hypothetical protein OES47_03335 [Acidobacteriota bacterium]|nr:hypothetical protein [Acidobacteriota bacterium]